MRFNSGTYPKATGCLPNGTYPIPTKYLPVSNISLQGTFLIPAYPVHIGCLPDTHLIPN